MFLKRTSFYIVSLVYLVSTVSTLPAREVFAWVASYNYSACLKNLQADFGGASPKDALTGIGLQFFRPSSSGGLVYETGVSDATVTSFTAVCKPLKIKVLITVYNNSQANPGWDWPLARTAFITNRSVFVKALVDKAVALELDGVDVDLEGFTANTVTQSDRTEYALFIKELGTALHEKGMILTIDSFHSPCFNSPNMAWWKDWKGYVDFIHSMGYGDLYESNATTFNDCPWDPTSVKQTVFKFSYQASFAVNAGLDTMVASVGMPAEDKNTWGGAGPTKHLQDILALKMMPSICIWDLSLVAGGEWKTAAPWVEAKKIKAIGVQTPITSAGLSVRQASTFELCGFQKFVCTFPAEGQYHLSLIDARGRICRIITDGCYAPGAYTFSFASSALATGVYFIRLTAGKETAIRPFVRLTMR